MNIIMHQKIGSVMSSSQKSPIFSSLNSRRNCLLFYFMVLNVEAYLGLNSSEIKAVFSWSKHDYFPVRFEIKIDTLSKDVFYFYSFIHVIYESTYLPTHLIFRTRSAAAAASPNHHHHQIDFYDCAGTTKSPFEKDRFQ